MENTALISEKTKSNAISAYLMIFISWLFLFNKENKYINNDFVKGHTKSAILIHLGFIITYIIFISNSLFASISILNFQLNDILANIIFIFLIILLVNGIYKSKKGITANGIFNFSIEKKEENSIKIQTLDINGDGNVSEEEKLTILLSFVPFIGFLNFGQYNNNKTIQSTTRLNIIITISIILLYIYGHYNLANILGLIYIILVTFIGINIFIRNQLINIDLPNVLSPGNLYKKFICLKDYIKTYFKSEDFRKFEDIEIENENKNKIISNNDLKELEIKKDFKISKILIYIPFINLLFLFFKDSKYKFHIANGLIITFLLTITFILGFFNYFNTSLNILFIIPILFGIGYINYKKAYRMPIIYDIYTIIKKILSVLKLGTKQIKEKKNTVKEVNLKVEK